jgi:sialidase-1
MTKEVGKFDAPEFPEVNAIYAARAVGAGGRELWVHHICRPLSTERKGPFVPLADGTLLTVDAEGLSISHDDGARWTQTIPAAHGQDPTEPASCAVLEAAPGTLVMAYLDLRSERRKFAWDGQTGEPANNCCLELCCIRSRDGGQNWVDRQCLLDGYSANFFGFIKTAGGRLVLVAEHLVTNPGRWVVCSFVSDDEGASWCRSNFIDLGGHGHHDGAIEPTVAELSDGRLLMLIRTNLGFFWQAFSDNGGRYWRIIEPSSIDASSSPGQLVRLLNGRLVLVWNRRDPEDWAWPLSNPGEQHSEFPASWHREELSIATSGDDGRTWSRPLVIARLRGGQLSYPHVTERREGELWITAGFASRRWFNEEPVPLGVRIFEDDLLLEALNHGA